MCIRDRGQHDHDPSMTSATAMFTTFNPFFPLPPGVAKCALSECPNACYVDESGAAHKCCSKSHAVEYQTRLETAAAMVPMPNTPLSLSTSTSSSSLPADKKCAIVECPNPRYVDESGTVHECCGITHAMEHQRRLALMKRKLTWIFTLSKSWIV